MKKLFLIAIISISNFQFSIATAQRPHREGPGPEKRPDITEMVSDLSSSQKSKLDAISSDSRKRVDALRKQQNAVRDSINMYMERDGDQSKALYPLFDREARLQAEISREMYATKVRFDKILTPEQRKELKNSRKQHQKLHRGRRQ